MPFIAGFVISAALLWLGAGVFAVARARALRSNRRLVLVALLIGGCGLWWPGHFLEPGEASAGLGGIPLVAAALALALAGLAGATALVATRKTVPAFAGLSLLTLGFAYAHSLFATPGLFRASAAVGSWGPAGAIVLLTALLVGLGLRGRAGPQGSRSLRVLQAAMGGLLLTLAASGSDQPGATLVPAWTEALLLLALVVTGAVLLEALGAAPGRDPEPARRVATTAGVPLVDSLTQLPTRVYFEDRLAARRPRPTPTPAAWRCCSSTSTASSRSTTPTATRSATSCSSRSASA